VLILSLDQNGERPGSGASTSPDADVAPSVYGWSLSYSQKVFTGNVVSPIVSVETETEPQGEAIGKRVWDLGGSECRAVTVRIGVQNLPRPQRVQTSEWSLFTRKPENGIETGVRRLGADMRAAGASPGSSRTYTAYRCVS
jgi:hypothetical protein